MRRQSPVTVDYIPPTGPASKDSLYSPGGNFTLVFRVRNRTTTSVSMSVFIGDSGAYFVAEPKPIQRVGSDEMLSPQGITLVAGEGATFYYNARVREPGDYLCWLSFLVTVGGSPKPVKLGPFGPAKIQVPRTALLS